MPTGIYPRTPAVDRFREKVEKQENGCWKWTATIQNLGYGQFSVNGHLVLAHRFSYELVNGTIPDGYELDHLCRNRSCVNPAHLEVVTHSENGKRGNSGLHTAMKNWAKTHCPQGHPYDEANTYYWRGQRKCRVCSKEAYKRWRDKNE